MRSRLTTEHVRAAVIETFGHMLINASEEFDVWLQEYVEGQVPIYDE